MNRNERNQDKGLIFNIQRYSLHDGPGIRTTVFMKGCPLNCRWCSNPESIKPYPQIMTNDLKCVRCAKCVKVCLQGAITIDGKRKINRFRCDLCLKCIEVCPTGALRVAGQYVTVEEVFSEVMKDELFYQNSGGGVTISGGEPLSQLEFVYSLLRECKRKGLHTTLDTSGYANWAVLDKVLRYVDLVLYDIKHMDSQSHKRGTGRNNTLILENVHLTTSRVKTWLRLPLIPGYNDSEANIKDIINFAKEIGAEKVSILPYHEWGKLKYKQLGRRYILKVKPPSEEYLQALKKIIENDGVRVTVGS